MNKKLLDILKPEINKFNKILSEASNTAIYFVDDGPAVFYRTVEQHKVKIQPIATAVGMKIIKYHMDEKPGFDFQYNTKIVPVVSYGKSDKWKQHILKVAEESGYEALRGISKRFGLQPDVLDAGTPEMYQKEKELNKNKQKRKNNKQEKKRFEENFKRIYSNFFQREIIE
tara:strand:- start:789 stop:1301 length:513 start_codon:yes stop_codon:yes gene_type:complete